MSKIDILAAELMAAQSKYDVLFDAAVHALPDEYEYEDLLHGPTLGMFIVASLAKYELADMTNDYANELSSYYHDLAVEIVRHARLAKQKVA